MNYEKRIWHASFKDYLTESEIVDRLLATCPNLQQGYPLYQDVLYVGKKGEHSRFKDCLSREIRQLFKRIIKMFKQSYKSIKT